MRHLNWLASLALLATPALAQDPLQELVPLMTVFGGSGDIPGYDVVGIRCAAYFYAQEKWRQEHGGQGPRPRFLTASETALQASVEHRIGEGQDRTRATLSVQDDVLRVMDLYLARFAANAASGHPWRGDPDLRGDQNYCEAALR